MEYTMPKALREVYNSEAGKFIFDNLKANYVDPSAMGKSDSQTHYLLGMKELVQQLFLLMEIQEITNVVETSNND